MNFPAMSKRWRCSVLGWLLFGFVAGTPLAGSNIPFIEARSANRTLYLNISSEASPGHQTIGPSYHGFSIEFFNFMDYSGNATYTNTLNTNLVKTLREVGGSPLEVRVGGSSQNNVFWRPNQTEALVPFLGAEKSTNVTLGPAFVEGFDAWPPDTKFIWGLSINPYNDSRLSDDIEITKRAYAKLGDRLIGLELGNEINSKSYSPADFVPVWQGYAYNISDAVFGGLNKDIFTVGAIQAPSYIPCDDRWSTDCWSINSLLELGINDKHISQRSSVHEYMDNAGNPWTADPQFLMNHNNTVFYPDYDAPDAAISASHDLPLYFGEANSFSGHGVDGVSNAFAAALWNIDFSLYCASTPHIAGINFHQGAGWKYSAWNPVSYWGVEPKVMPSYYGHWFMQSVLKGGGKQVQAVFESQRFVVYAVYGDAGRRLEAVVAVNLEAYDSSSGGALRSEVTVQLPHSIMAHHGSKAAQVSRLTSAGADVQPAEEMTFAGQWVDSDGVVQGDKVTEKLGQGGTVTVKASEAVLIAF